MINYFSFKQLVLTPLTKREIEVLDLISQGYSNEDIAAFLFIGGKTVQTHYTNILSKLNIDWNKKEIQNSVIRLRAGLIWQKHKCDIDDFSQRKVYKNEFKV